MARTQECILYRDFENGEILDTMTSLMNSYEAKEEGFEKLAFLFEEVGKIEKEHEERYRALLANIENDRVFKRDEQKVWICTNCGKIVIAKEAPAKCPVCDHPQGYFELRAMNY